MDSDGCPCWFVDSFFSPQHIGCRHLFKWRWPQSNERLAYDCLYLVVLSNGNITNSSLLTDAKQKTSTTCLVVPNCSISEHLWFTFQRHFECWVVNNESIHLIPGEWNPENLKYITIFFKVNHFKLTLNGPLEHTAYPLAS